MESSHKIKLSEKNYSCGSLLILAGSSLKLTGSLLKLIGSLFKLTGSLLILSRSLLKQNGSLLKLTGSYVSFCPNSLEKVYMTSYHFSSYLKYFPRIVGALRYSSSFPLQLMSVTQNMKIGCAMRHQWRLARIFDVKSSLTTINDQLSLHHILNIGQIYI